MRKGTFCVTLGPGQIVGMLRVRNDNALLILAVSTEPEQIGRHVVDFLVRLNLSIIFFPGLPGPQGAA